MKDFLKEASKKLKTLKEQDKAIELQKEQEAIQKRMAEDNETILQCNKRAKEIYESMSKLIETALDKRLNFIKLYSYRLDSDGRNWTEKPSLRNTTIMNELKRLLANDSIKFEVEYNSGNDEGWYGSDSIGNPSYWQDVDLIVKF